MKVVSAYFGLLLIPLFLFSCKNEASEELMDSQEEIVELPAKDTSEIEIKAEDSLRQEVSSLDLSERQSSLVNIQQVDSSIQIDIRYATSNNFMGKVLYENIHHVFLQKDVALKLKNAQKFLKEEHPTWSLLVFDGGRPLSIQQKMWDALDSIPAKRRGNFLSNPASGGSIHNYGAAVDLTIVDENGKELDMGTPYDDIRQLAYPRLEKQFLASGELQQEQVDHRKLLRKVMNRAGFYNIETEWWHFNSCTRAQAMKKCDVIP